MSRARDISNFSVQDSRLSNVDSDYIEPLLTPIHISGDVAMIGRTSSSSSTAGAQFSADGNNIVRDGQSALTIKRLTSDGDIATFAKDGSTVGTIYNGGGNLGVNSSGGLLLVNDIITPTSGDDNTHDLGRPSARWKDLYLSSGLYVGGTGSSNKLDDYEEGSWTPTLTSTSGVTKTAATGNIGRYTKIGNLVNVTGTVQWNGTQTLSGLVAVGGLPFASVNTNGYRSAAAMGAAQGVYQSGSYVNGLAMSLDQNSTVIWVVARSTSSYTHTPTISNNGAIYGINCSYRTA